jgi:AcrR family transcriptional regulator
MDAKSPKTIEASPSSRPRYHHGALREAMVAATVALVEELGPERVSVREAARRAGVSSGAPFRHFPSRAALLTAAAEEAMQRFRAEIDVAMAAAQGKDPLVRLSALASAYLRWAVRNPTLFEILGDRRPLDLENHDKLRRDLTDTQALVMTLLLEASALGLLRSDDVFNLALNARTMIYGLAHMYVDRQLLEWGIDDAGAEHAMAGAVNHYLRGIAADPDRHEFLV